MAAIVHHWYTRSHGFNQAHQAEHTVDLYIDDRLRTLLYIK
jgi:hypothetical protein